MPAKLLQRDEELTESENREIHQTVPDHRVKLTPDGWQQVSPPEYPQPPIPTKYSTDPLLKAEEAGKKLRALLRPDDTLHFFTSPYRRTRETTEGILNSLTSNTPTPSPFPRHTIKVYEEPRLREQDFGNFQPNSAEMGRMWQERADYGHFFYRIPNGESAADAYDRVSGFNESLWRSFGEDDFANVCVLVTHGLMTRVFLMKWYHFSVEYFEDLRNINHCEFVVMKLNPDNGKYVLQNNLRTWSELKRERANSKTTDNNNEPASPIPVRKRWGGCHDGVDGDDFARRQRARRQNTVDLFNDDDDEANVTALAEKMQRAQEPRGRDEGLGLQPLEEESAQTDAVNVHKDPSGSKKRFLSPERLEILHAGRDGGGSRSGAASPNRSVGPDGNNMGAEAKERRVKSLPVRGRGSLALALNGELDGDAPKHRVRADALGDQSDVEDENVNEGKEDEYGTNIERLEAKDRSFAESVR